VSETPEHREIPLTLAFKPDDGKGDDSDYRQAGYEAIAIVQPSMEEEGRIFVGINPFGKPVGVHMLPDEARRVRDHLSKLLLEPEAVEEVARETRETPESLQSRIDRAVERAKAPTPEQTLASAQRAPSRPRRARVPRVTRFPRPQFRVEFKWGRFEAILARVDGS
jgi:hypothetical protein